MKQEIIEEYHRKVRDKLTRYLSAEGLRKGDTVCECPVCHQPAVISPVFKEYYCEHCHSSGDILDYARLQYPGRDDWELIRHIYQKLKLKIQVLETMSSRELAQQEFAPLEYLAEPVLPKEGLVLLAAPAKTGKSWMVLQLAAAVLRGESFLGFPTKKTRVLYLSLEDHAQRLYERAESMGCLGSPDLYFATRAELLGQGFEEALCAFLEQEQGIGLVIVDTLQKIREISSEGYSYSRDYDVMNRLKAISQRFSIAVVLVHHTNKMEETGDEMNRVSGTTAMTGGVDATWVLRRPDRLKGEALMQISGRDMEDMRLRLRFDRENLRWQNLGAETEPEAAPDREGELVRELLGLVREEEWIGSPEQLLEELRGKLPRGLPATSASLSRWMNRQRDRLWEQGLGYEARRSGNQRTFLLFRRRDASDASDGILGEGNSA